MDSQELARLITPYEVLPSAERVEGLMFLLRLQGQTIFNKALPHYRPAKTTRLFMGLLFC
jgi:hypothetical protein